jgi:protein-tyrosine phosphatase
MDSSNGLYAFPISENNKCNLTTSTPSDAYTNVNADDYFTSKFPSTLTSSSSELNSKLDSTSNSVSTSILTTKSAKSSSNKHHKRGSENSLFNSGATLVDNFTIPTKVLSNNSEISLSSSSSLNQSALSETQTLVSCKINEEESNNEGKLNNHDQNLITSLTNSFQNVDFSSNDSNGSTNDNKLNNINTQNQTQTTDYFASPALYSNRGLINRSKFHGLGHRTTKSENFTLKLSKKLEKKSINQLNGLQEEEINVTDDKDNINDINDNNHITTSMNTTITDTNINHNTYFEPLPSAPVDSKNNFSYINQPNSNISDNFDNPSPLYPQFSPKSPDFKFNNLRKTNSLLNRNLNNDFSSSSDSLPLRSSIKFKSNNLKLPSMVKLLRISDAESLTHSWSNSIGSDSLSNLLIIDVRPFHDYCKSHMKNSINICLPSTLLKRSTFTLEKCIQTLTNKEKRLFEKYFERNAEDLPNVLFYDDYLSTENNISSSIFYLAGKFLQNANWNSSLYILENGFSKFNEYYSTLSKNSITGSNNLMISFDNDLSSTSINTETFSPSTTASPHSLISPGNLFIKPSSASSISLFPNKSPVGLSRFILPDTSNIPIFKTRNYDELITDKPDLSIHLSTILTPNEISSLPNWLGDVIGNDLGSSKLTEKFNNLQVQERTRLNKALNKSNNTIMDDNDVSAGETPIISSGVELGRKNRYKDIFLYEHARVRLNSTNEIDDYINASYISYPRTNLNYIATQGPLDETIGDFWKIVYDNEVPIIFSLTPQSENLVEKCAPYWNPGTFYSNNIKIDVSLLEEIDDLNLSFQTEAHCISRRLLVKIDNKPQREVLQIHMMSWPDFGIVICEEDILSLVSMKRYVCSKLNNTSKPILVHCSAGCGRTGSFCVIDTCIDILCNDEITKKVETQDLIFDITSVFRSQRVFMVQTLRQYILIYDSIIKFIKMHAKSNRLIKGDILTTQGLIDWEIKDPGILKRFIESYS